MNKLSFGFDCDRSNYTFNWPAELNKEVLEKLAHNPFFTNWETMSIGNNPLKRITFDFGKALKKVLSDSSDLCIWGQGEGNEFLFNRNKNYYHIRLTLEKKILEKDKLLKFQEYMINLAIDKPRFTSMSSSLGSEYSDIQKRHNIEQEKSLFSYMSWLNVLSPLAYNGFYEKEDLLKAPFYRVEEIKKDIILIQAYKDPFDLENEESLNYLRKGVEYLNKNIIFLKEQK
jgi:hypothetical protein